MHVRFGSRLSADQVSWFLDGVFIGKICTVTYSKFVCDQCNISLSGLDQYTKILFNQPIWGKDISSLPQNYHNKPFEVFEPSPFPFCLDAEFDMVSYPKHANKNVFLKQYLYYFFLASQYLQQAVSCVGISSLYSCVHFDFLDCLQAIVNSN